MNSILEILAFWVGLLYLYLEYRADPKFWIVSMIMPCISMWVYFSKGIYADFAINIYYLLIAIYGYWNWISKRHGKRKKPLPIRHINWRVFAGSTVVVMALWAFIAWFLKEYTDSTIPYADGFTTALSIVAMWLGAQKYAEQWLAWLIVDAVTVPIQISKGLIFYPILYSIYTVIAIYGYLNWLKIMKTRVY